MKLYVAGPMTGLPQHNFPAFHRATARLRSLDHVVINPAETFGGREDLSRADYGRYDISALLQVEGIVLLAGWSNSTGARTELAIALWLGLKTFFWFDSTETLQEIEPENPAAVCVGQVKC